MGSLLSVYGCFQYKKQMRTRVTADQLGNDAENGIRLPLIKTENEKRKSSDSKTLRSCVQLFQIIFQVDREPFGYIYITCNFEDF